MISLRRRDMAATPPRLKAVFAHQAADLLVIDDEPALAKRGANAACAVIDRRRARRARPHELAPVIAARSADACAASSSA